MKLALKITPQRSTQYAQMTTALAAPELRASPLRQAISELQPVTLAGQSYLLATVADTLLSDSAGIQFLSRLGAISEVYEYFERIGETTGPLLRPIEPQFTPFVPLEMAEIRRYKGKTNETFTRVLLNVALFAGDYATRAIEEPLRVLDPLAGGGTTLFLALAAGHHALGIELDRQDIETTVGFVRQFLEGEHIPFKELDERRKVGRRYQFEIGPKGNTRHLILTHGDSREASLHLREVPGGPRVHAIVGDLPYGIQHFGEISSLLARALPVWESLLLPGGTIALAWNATRIERAEMLGLFELHTKLQVRNDPPYGGEFVHAVDRVIKRRDILVGRKVE